MIGVSGRPASQLVGRRESVCMRERGGIHSTEHLDKGLRAVVPPENKVGSRANNVVPQSEKRIGT